MNLNFSLADINEAAGKVYDVAGDKKVWALHGEMGAGKTTFIHALCETLEVTSAVSSPTYSIINEYLSISAGIIYHIDLYRLKDEEEVLQAGVEECISSGNLCLIEWPERATSLLPDNALHITIEAVNDSTRQLKLN